MFRGFLVRLWEPSVCHRACITRISWRGHGRDAPSTHPRLQGAWVGTWEPQSGARGGPSPGECCGVPLRSPLGGGGTATAVVVLPSWDIAAGAVGGLQARGVKYVCLAHRDSARLHLCSGT